MDEPLLAVEDIHVAFRGSRGSREVLCGVSLDVRPREIVGIVGESGSGKSVTALAVMRLLGTQGAITSGSVRLESVELTTLDEAAMRDLRGRKIAMVFQEPMTSLNPLFSIGFQIAEVLREKLKADAEQWIEAGHRLLK